MFKMIVSYFSPGNESYMMGGGGEVASDLPGTMKYEDELTGTEDFAHLPDEEGRLPDDNETVAEDASEESAQEALLKDIGLQTAAGLNEVRKALQLLCTDTDPQFIQIGRDLQNVSSETKNLTQSLLEAVQFVGDKSSETGILESTENLIASILDRLAKGRQSLEESTKNARDLVGKIYEFHDINDQIDTISSHFKVVRFNIRIQCSSILVSETMFKSVTEDIDSLSRKLHFITAQIKNELTTSGKKLQELERSVSSNLARLRANADEAEGSVQHVFQDIQQLMQGASVIIEEARSKSLRISRKIEDVVVNIQFHDSMSQRVDHIIRALDDVCSISDPEQEDITPDRLGSAWLILDLQHRQLIQIIDEIGTVKNRISTAFQIMEEEVSGLNEIQCREQFEAIGPQQFLCSRFTSLKETLFKLSELLSESDSMLEQMRKSARETERVTARLQEMMNDIQEVREDTRLQAVNTIIMATNLGQKGRTIQVLAKEINNLSDQTGEVAAEAKEMQLAINKTVEELLHHSDEKQEDEKLAEVDIVTKEIGESCNNVEDKISDVSKGILKAGNNIDTIRSSLFFLDNLEHRLDNITGQVERVKDLLSPWQDKASIDSEEMEQLIERYTMDRERAIHSFGQQGEKQEEQGDEDIFF